MTQSMTHRAKEILETGSALMKINPVGKQISKEEQEQRCKDMIGKGGFTLCLQNFTSSQNITDNAIIGQEIVLA